MLKIAGLRQGGLRPTRFREPHFSDPLDDLAISHYLPAKCSRLMVYFEYPGLFARGGYGYAEDVVGQEPGNLLGPLDQT